MSSQSSRGSTPADPLRPQPQRCPAQRHDGQWARRSVPADALFILIGSQPRTEWLGDSIARDQWGFILTGPDLPIDTDTRRPLGRPPLPLETSLPGVFAAGDVREGSVKRVAAAVGEGAATIPLVHRYLQTSTATAPAVTLPRARKAPSRRHTRGRDSVSGLVNVATPTSTP